MEQGAHSSTMKAASVGVNSCMQRAMTLELEAAQSSCGAPQDGQFKQVSQSKSRQALFAYLRHRAAEAVLDPHHLPPNHTMIRGQL